MRSASFCSRIRRTPSGKRGNAPQPSASQPTGRQPSGCTATRGTVQRWAGDRSHAPVVARATGPRVRSLAKRPTPVRPLAHTCPWSSSERKDDHRAHHNQPQPTLQRSPRASDVVDQPRSSPNLAPSSTLCGTFGSTGRTQGANVRQAAHRVQGKPEGRAAIAQSRAPGARCDRLRVHDGTQERPLARGKQPVAHCNRHATRPMGLPPGRTESKWQAHRWARRAGEQGHRAAWYRIRVNLRTFASRCDRSHGRGRTRTRSHAAPYRSPDLSPQERNHASHTVSAKSGSAHAN